MYYYNQNGWMDGWNYKYTNLLPCMSLRVKPKNRQGLDLRGQGHIKFGLDDYITACRLVCVFEEVHLAVSSFLITILKQLKVTSERPLRRCAWRKKAPMHNN